MLPSFKNRLCLFTGSFTAFCVYLHRMYAILGGTAPDGLSELFFWLLVDQCRVQVYATQSGCFQNLQRYHVGCMEILHIPRVATRATLHPGVNGATKMLESSLSMSQE